ncbi:hypothetical protein [Dyella sp. 333MFSha]|uniref:hypothetical protein n=1 Tax=Dyella sp. 333MFSha TaxID=1798240 RepID=UPI00088BCD01|nr:hypothetical protein [Dyella sp. 333MFSha]SDF57164.1 hypothetical protein SAMN04515659_1259 [Dyella sp. 333MFSha]
MQTEHEHPDSPRLDDGGAATHAILPDAAPPPPLIHEVDANGGLGYDLVGPNAAGSIGVIVGPWDGFVDGDIARIRWGGTTGPVVGSRLINAEDNGKAIPVTVRASAIHAIGAGTFDVVHENVGASGTVVYSPSLSVEVKLSVPGGLDPDPSTETINEGLKPPEVVPWPLGADLSNVRIVVARYLNIEAGDRITASWHGFQHEITLSSADVAKPSFEIAIPEDEIRQIGAGTATVTYRILDRVTNSSKWAPHTQVEVPLPDPGALPAPRVKEADTDQTVIDLGTLGTGDVTVQPVNNGGLKGASITVTWTGVAEDGTTPRPYSPPPQLLTYDYQVPEFIIPNAEVAALGGTAGGGRASIAYKRTNPGDTPVQSKRRDLRVIGASSELPAPKVDEAINYTIPAELGVAHLVIPPQTRGNQVTANIAAPVPFTDSKPMSDPSKPPDFTLTGTAFIAPNAGSPATATYTVTGPNYSATSLPYQFGILPPAVPNLPLPGIVEAVAGQIDPAVAPNGITASIPASSDIRASDDVIVTVAGPGGQETTAAQSGNPSGMKIDIGPAVVAKNLAHAITVQYSVTPKAGGAAKSSPIANFNVLDFQPNDPRVGKPVIRQALGTSVIDLNQFVGDALIDVPKWPLMATGQLYWLTASTANGSQVIATAKPVTGGSAFSEPLPRLWLNTLSDQTTLVLTLEVAFDGGAQATARKFTSLAYTVRATVAPPAFPAPVIPQAIASRLDGNRTSADLEVPPTAPLLSGDSVAASFGTHALPTKTASPTLDPFKITAAMIAAERGRTVVSTYTVTRAGTTLPVSAPLSVFVTAGGEQWDATFDFDGEQTRSVSSETKDKLEFDKVFHVMFDRNHHVEKEQFIGVKPYSGAGLDDYYKGDILWIGHPTNNELILKTVLFNLFEEWTEVRFAVSSMDDPVYISFKDASGSIIGGKKTLNAGSGNGQYAEVRNDVVAGKKVKWIEIVCKDSIHVDFFKFKR